jgi:L-aspartate oxidase
VMWDYVGIVRSDLRLNRAKRRISLLYDEIEDFYRRTDIQNKILELRNLVLVARLIVDSALARKESRGLHYTTDYPENRNPSHHYTSFRRTS